MSNASGLLTIFGAITHRDSDMVAAFRDAHEIKHRSIGEEIVRQGFAPVSPVPMDGDMDPDWFGRHEMLHRAIEDVLGLNVHPVLTATDEIPPWSSTDGFFYWMEIHNQKHTLIEQTLGLV